VYALGSLVAAFLVVQLVLGIKSYLTPSSLPIYIQPGAYALVTGASDGIGKALAMELASRGMNVIIHGRNEEKLEAVRQGIEAQVPRVDVRILVADATKVTEDTLQVLLQRQIKGLKISILINNVGFSNRMRKVPELDLEKDILDVIAVNSIFPTIMTRTVLPHMTKPGLILSIGSGASFVPPPYLASYAGAKAYFSAFTEVLRRELRGTGIDVQLMVANSVVSGSNKTSKRLDRPTSKTFAKCCMNAVGKGAIIRPYWMHSIMSKIVSMVPSATLDESMETTMLAIIEELKEARKE